MVVEIAVCDFAQIGSLQKVFRMRNGRLITKHQEQLGREITKRVSMGMCKHHLVYLELYVGIGIEMGMGMGGLLPLMMVKNTTHRPQQDIEYRIAELSPP